MIDSIKSSAQISQAAQIGQTNINQTQMINIDNSININTTNVFQGNFGGEGNYLNFEVSMDMSLEEIVKLLQEMLKMEMLQTLLEALSNMQDQPYNPQGGSETLSAIGKDDGSFAVELNGERFLGIDPAEADFAVVDSDGTSGAVAGEEGLNKLSAGMAGGGGFGASGGSSGGGAGGGGAAASGGGAA